MRVKLTWREARDMMLAVTEPVDTEQVSLRDAAGRIVALPISAVRNVPPFDRSPFDGYAFRSEDTAGALPVELTILEEVPAGSVPTKPVLPGTATKILTGAPIPPGADAITKFEETTFTAEKVVLKRTYRPDENIIHQGEDIAEGEPLAQVGQILDAGLAGTLASQGISTATVFRAPKVAIITTGSELSDAEGELEPGKILNSNLSMMETALRRAGCIPLRCANQVDRVENIVSALSVALEQADAVITTGGVSVGDYDLTPEAYRTAGVTPICGDLKLKPGGKCCFGQKDGKLVMGLSGNPASAMTCFYAVALPVLRKLQGRVDGTLPEFPVKLGKAFPKRSPQPRLLRGHLTVEQGTLTYYPAEKQGNGALQTLAGSNAMVEIPAGTGPLEAGTVLQAIYYGEI